MKSLSSLVVLVAAVVVCFGGGLVGCGPTKTGLEARKAAKDRMAKASSLIVYDQAKQAFESAQFDLALKNIDEAIYRRPTEAKYWVLRGRIHLETARLEQANKDFEMAVEQDPKYAEAYYCIGIVNERWGKDAVAVAAYSKAAETDPAKVSYLLAAAETMVAMGEYDAAREKLEGNLSLFENNAPMHQLLGKIAMLQNDPAQAAKQFNRALLIDPKLPMILENLMRAQFAAEMWQDCLGTVRRLQRETAEGRTPERMRIEGRCLAMTGRTADARIVFADLTRQAPEDVAAWVELAAVAWEAGELSRTQTAAARIVRLAPERFEGYLFQGLVAEERGDAEAATQWFQKAAEVSGHGDDPNSFLLSLGRGTARPARSTAAAMDDR